MAIESPGPTGSFSTPTVTGTAPKLPDTSTRKHSYNYCEFVCALQFAKGDGSDDTEALRAAVNEAAATGRGLWIPKTPNGYRVSGQITISEPMWMLSNGATIIPDVPVEADTNILFIASSAVTIEGLHFDGSKIAERLVSGNRRMIYAGSDAGPPLTHIDVRQCSFVNLKQFGGPEPATVKVCHAVYFNGVEDASLEDFFVDTISGAAIFCRHTRRAHVRRGTIKDTGWYSVHYDGDNTDFEVCDLSIIGEAPNIRYWGASIDIMGDFHVGSDTHGRIHDVYVTGHHSYPGEGAVRLSSAAHVDLYNFDFDGLMADAVITVQMRQAEGQPYQAAPQEITIRDGRMRARGKSQLAIFAQNGRREVGGTGPIGKAVGLDIRDVVAESTGPENYFQGIFVHGQDGGWDEVTVENTRVSGKPGETPTSGLVGITVNPERAMITNVRVRRNRLRFFDGTTQPAENSRHSGVYLGGTGVDGAEVRGNHLEGFWYGIYSQDPGAKNLSGLVDNTFTNSVNSWINRGDGVIMDGLTSSVALAPGTLAAGETVTGSVSIKGARPGDGVQLGPPAKWPSGLDFKGLVPAPDRVELVVRNPGSAPISLPPVDEGKWSVQVVKF